MKNKGVVRPTAAAFMLMMAMALTTTGVSFFVTPVCEFLQVGRGSVSLVYSLIVLTGALAASFEGKFIQKKGVRPLMIVAAVWTAVCFVLFSLSQKLWMFYAIALLMGPFAHGCVMFCATVIVQQTFAGAAMAGVTGLVMAGSGVGGALTSMVVPLVIDAMGWRAGYICAGLLWLVLVVLALVLLPRKTQNASAQAEAAAPQDGMTYQEAIRSPKLYLMMIAMFLVTGANTVQQHLPAIATDMGSTAAQVSVMLSAVTILLAVGKIAQGALYAKAGVIRGGWVTMGCFALSLLLIMWNGNTLPLVAIGMGIATTLMPIAARQVFGSKEYAAIWGLVSAAHHGSGCVNTPLWGIVYDVAGSYNPALIGYAIACILAQLALIGAMKKKA